MSTATLPQDFEHLNISTPKPKSSSPTEDMSTATLPQDFEHLNISTPKPKSSSPTDTIRPTLETDKPIIDRNGKWVIYPPIPPKPRVKRHWLYGWRIDKALVESWVDKVRPGRHLQSYDSHHFDPYIVMAELSGYDPLIFALAVPKDVTDPVDGVEYDDCDAWALSSNYSKRRFYTRPLPAQLEMMIKVLGYPYWFLDGLGDPDHHYQYYM